MSICVWLLSLSIIFLRLTHVLAGISTLFHGWIIFQCDGHSTSYLSFPQLLAISVTAFGYLEWFLNISFNYLGYISRGRITTSYVNSNLVRNHWSVSIMAILVYIHISNLWSLQFLIKACYFLLFLIIAISVGVKR